MYHARKPTRLPGYDYSADGYYFVTVCTHRKQCLLGKIVGDGFNVLPVIELSSVGKIVRKAIEYMGARNTGYGVDHYVIMPNHIHLIIKLEEKEGGHRGPPLHSIIGRFKSYTTHEYGKKLWQRSFHDHIIRGDKDYEKIWCYIENNGAKWKSDCFYMEEM